MASVEQWQDFFEACEIPADTCAKFARTFHSQRIQPDMLGELDRETFAALGVTMIGDQIAITRYTKKCNGNIPEFAVKRAKSPARRVNLAPDRHDIYHVRLPAGNTPKTREMLKKHEMLKQEGMIQRGTTGVRKGGLTCDPVSKDGMSRVSTTSTVITKRKPGVVAAPSVVLKSPAEPKRSVTIPRYGTLVSDSMVGGASSKTKSIMVSDVSSSSSAASRLTRQGEPTFLITLGGNRSQRSVVADRLGGRPPGPSPVQRRQERVPISRRLTVRDSGRRPLVVYDEDEDMASEEVIYEQPSVFDRVSVKRRF
uniref:SAM domain-containing protein n=1 Tax=Steinernema glaseri TaxID=37863 RepID=A0A1I8A7T9_9BILA